MTNLRLNTHMSLRAVLAQLHGRLSFSIITIPHTTIPTMTTALPSPVETQELVYRHTFLTAEHKLAIVKLCVEKQEDFVQGRKTQLWATISQLLLQEVNVGLRDLAGMRYLDI